MVHLSCCSINWRGTLVLGWVLVPTFSGDRFDVGPPQYVAGDLVEERIDVACRMAFVSFVFCCSGCSWNCFNVKFLGPFLEFLTTVVMWGCWLFLLAAMLTFPGPFFFVYYEFLFLVAIFGFVVFFGRLCIPRGCLLKHGVSFMTLIFVFLITNSGLGFSTSI